MPSACEARDETVSALLAWAPAMMKSYVECKPKRQGEVALEDSLKTAALSSLKLPAEVRGGRLSGLTFGWGNFSVPGPRKLRQGCPGTAPRSPHKASRGTGTDGQRADARVSRPAGLAHSRS